jgi:hypothetical protein
MRMKDIFFRGWHLHRRDHIGALASAFLQRTSSTCIEGWLARSPGGLVVQG